MTVRLEWRTIIERLQRSEMLEQIADRKQILARRAELLARPTHDTAQSGASDTVLTFRVGVERFAIPAAEIIELVETPKIAKVPHAAPEVAGLIQIRGEVRPVYHLTMLLGLPHQGGSPKYVLILRSDSRIIGVAVDETEDVRVVPQSLRKTGVEGRARAGWATDDLIPVLAASSLLQKDE